MLSEEQLTMRRTGIGSSDIAAIAQQDPHSAAIDIWLDKMGLREQGGSTATWIGDRLEEAVAALYAERVGIELVKQINGTRRHRAIPWALATPDRIACAGGPAEVVEIKNVGSHMAHLWGESGSTEVPIDKLIQVQWQAEVLDVERVDIAALIGGTDFRVYPIRRDRDLGADLLELGRWFWEEHVLTKIPPPHDGEAAKRLAAMRWRKSSAGMLPATPEAEALRDRLLRVKRMAKRVGDLQGQLEARAMEMIGESAGIDGCFTWKSDAEGRPAWKAIAEALMVVVRNEADATNDLLVNATIEELVKANTGEPARRFLTKEPKAKKERR